MTGFTHARLPFVSDYLRVLSKRQDSLASIKRTAGFTREYLPLTNYYLPVQMCMTRVTREYFQLISNRSRAMYFSCHMNLTHELSLNFLEHKALLVFL